MKTCICLFAFFVIPVFLPSFLSSLRAFFGRSVRSSPARHLSVRPSVTLFCLSVCLFVCLSACVSVYLCGLCLSVSQSVFSFLLSSFVPQAGFLKTVYFFGATRYQSLHTHLGVLIDMIQSDISRTRRQLIQDSSLCSFH